MAPRAVSCGVLVTDGHLFLIGHATRSPRWDIPKGLAEAEEAHAAAAIRELAEETGLVAAEADLVVLGRHRYLPVKDLVLFLLRLPVLPDPATLACSTTFTVGGSELPEFDRFALVQWEEMLGHVGKNMARVLAAIGDRLDAILRPELSNR